MPDAQRLGFSSVQGDDIVRSWTRSVAGRTFNAATLLVQMRNTETNALVATSEDSPPDGALAIDTSVCDFTDPDAYVFGFKIEGTDGIAASHDYVIEAQCETDHDDGQGARIETFFSEAWEIRQQWAVPS